MGHFGEYRGGALSLAERGVDIKEGCLEEVTSKSRLEGGSVVPSTQQMFKYQ